MHIRRVVSAVLIMMTLILGAASAEESLWAGVDGEMLNIRWDAKGSCVLTVYRNGWPMLVESVNGNDGAKSVRIGSLDGVFSVRLKTPDGCLETVAVKEGTAAPEPTMDPDEIVIAVPTIVPEIRPSATAAPIVMPQPTASVGPLATAAPGTGNGGQVMSSMAAEIVSDVNAERAKYGLQPLSVDPALVGAAAIRANEIVSKFSHTRPDGTSWSTVSGSALGENIAKGHNSAYRVMAAWMSSDGHRANILRESFGSIGVYALKVNGVIYWVQLFGR